jgi:hypothetical protein
MPKDKHHHKTTTDLFDIHFKMCRQKLMNVIFSLLLGLIMCNSSVAGEKDFRCLKSIGLKNPLRLQFVFQANNRNEGYVLYQNGSGPIPVKLVSEKTIREVPDGRPWEFRTEWEEGGGNGSGGKYIIISQGAVISEFKYVRKKDGRIFSFEEDREASAGNGCEWNRK